MMESFVLTVVKDNVLDACEVFESSQAALDSARYFCEMANIELSDNPVYDSKMNGWLISDSYGYFVTVVKRYPHSTTHMIYSSYGLFLDKLSARGFPRRGAAYSYASAPIISAPPLPPLQSALSSVDDDMQYTTEYLNDIVGPPPGAVFPKIPVDTVAPGDNPKDMSLPGGFNNLKGRHLTMQEVYNYPSTVTQVAALNEHQKWALILARTKHRPKQVILLPGLGCWSQHHMLKELVSQSELGKKMRDQELAVLQSMYLEALQLAEEEYEESSSSWDEDESYG